MRRPTRGPELPSHRPKGKTPATPGASARNPRSCPVSRPTPQPLHSMEKFPVSRSAQPFGRYELLERISAGGMAEVFRATDTAKNHIVALKRILPQIAEDEEFVAMFEDEARIASQLEHPHIARMLD